MPTLAEIMSGNYQQQPMGGLAQLQMPPVKDRSWYREDGSQKGQGFLGPLKFHDGRTSSELSIGVNIDGNEVEIPSLVPTLSKDEIDHLLGGGAPTAEIVDKAVSHARMRMQQGLPVFAE